MKSFLLLLLSIMIATVARAQSSPCASNPVYRQLDFWVGEWEAFGKKGQKAGDSKISIILDSCIILEEWTSVKPPKGITYAGKSYNTYNAQTNQWQQTWVDNVGGSTAYLTGQLENGTMVFKTIPVVKTKDSVEIQRLSFFNLGPDKVRQLFESSSDNGKTWTITVDLEYRRKK
jgi:hypothetical protein